MNYLKFESTRYLNIVWRGIANIVFGNVYCTKPCIFISKAEVYSVADLLDIKLYILLVWIKQFWSLAILCPSVSKFDFWKP